MFWKTIGLFGAGAVFAICCFIGYLFATAGFWPEIIGDLSGISDAKLKSYLSPNVSAEFFAFWFALLSTVITSFIIYKITNSAGIQKIRQNYSLQILGAFNAILYQVADALREAADTISRNSKKDRGNTTSSFQQFESASANSEEKKEMMCFQIMTIFV